MNELETIDNLVEKIRPHLAGQRPEIQGAVLAQLLSLWLAGHYQFGLDAIHALLARHDKTVRALLPIDINILKDRSSDNANRTR